MPVMLCPISRAMIMVFSNQPSHHSISKIIQVPETAMQMAQVWVYRRSAVAFRMTNRKNKKVIPSKATSSSSMVQKPHCNSTPIPNNPTKVMIIP